MGGNDDFYSLQEVPASSSSPQAGNLYVANCHSSGDWQFKQPVAMALPTVILDFDVGFKVSDVSFKRNVGGK